MLATGLPRAGYDRVFVPTWRSIAIGFSQFLPVLRSRAWFKSTPINCQCPWKMFFRLVRIVLISCIAGLLFIVLEHVEHWERIASR